MHAAETPTNTDLRNHRRRPKSSIWLAIAVALVVHVLLVLAPGFRQLKKPLVTTPEIEIQIRYEDVQPMVEIPAEPVPEVVKTPAEELVEQSVEERYTTTEPKPPLTAIEVTQEPPAEAATAVPTTNDSEQVNAADRQRLSSIILSSQYITEPSVTETIFGPGIPQIDPAPEKAFHFPVKPNMITMLDKPIPDLPFAYTPDLVHFAYDPGVKGDLQRFWDNITPEFGLRTKYGTEVKCVWVLVVVACGWGRPK
jgi:hypothetical protein